MTSDPPTEGSGLNRYLAELTKAPKVLVIEDDPLILPMFIQSLNLFDCQPIASSSGSSAIAAMKADAFDLIVMDLQLPDMPYLEVARSIAELQPIIPVVVVSGYIDERAMSDLPDILDRPLWFIRKPMDFRRDRISKIFASLKIRAPLRASLKHGTTQKIKTHPKK